MERVCCGCKVRIGCYKDKTQLTCPCGQECPSDFEFTSHGVCNKCLEEHGIDPSVIKKWEDKNE